MHEIAISRAPPSQAISQNLKNIFENPLKSDACNWAGPGFNEDWVSFSETPDPHALNLPKQIFIDYARQQGLEYIDQHHFVRHTVYDYILKAEYLVDGFADVEYFVATATFRYVNYEIKNLLDN